MPEPANNHDADLRVVRRSGVPRTVGRVPSRLGALRLSEARPAHAHLDVLDDAGPSSPHALGDVAHEYPGDVAEGEEEGRDEDRSPRLQPGEVAELDTQDLWRKTLGRSQEERDDVGGLE